MDSDPIFDNVFLSNDNAFDLFKTPLKLEKVIIIVLY